MVDLLQWLGQSAARATELQALVKADKGLVRIPLQDLQLEAPVPRPGKIVAIGRNYADHAKETGVKPFEKPRIVSKFGSSVARPGSMTVRPEGIVKLDFEVELAVVMGRSAKQVRRADALSFVAGYTILNDVSARELQFDVNPAQTTFAKSMDGFCPMGPYLLTADELPDPQDVELNLWLNGELMQHGHTRDMLFPVAHLIEYISRYVTLEPGDVIATGTPAGIGAFRTPPVWLKPGDELKLAITHLGALVHGVA
jgi:2-keto-4-pentenoate hydratase/2-oxohepta-3-ene-1,7-dioic acid hydratase in catechol pathway